MPAPLQHYLSSCREVVDAHKVTPQAEAYAQDQGAAAFQDLKRIVRDFGMCNTLTMLADVATEASQLEDDDWEKAAIAINDSPESALIVDLELYRLIDQALDDGNLSTGNFRLGTNNCPILILEP